MQITKEFLEAEMSDLEREIEKAKTFITQAQGALNAYTVLLNRLDAPEETESQNGNAI